MLRRSCGRLVSAPGATPLPAFVPAIWVAGLNWESHAKEVNLEKPKEPIFCMKSPSSLLYPRSLQFTESNNAATFCGSFGHVVRVPKMLQSPPETDYEGELAVVIGKPCSNMTPQQVAESDVIRGYCCALDITARRWQGKKGGGQWCVAKSFDTFLPLGPEVVPIPLADLPGLTLTTKLNGKVVQQDRFSGFLFDVATIVSFLSRVSRLVPGTVVLTGTPSGVGFARKAKARALGTGGDGAEVLVPDPYYLVHGDHLEVSIERIGSLACLVEFDGRSGPRLPI